MVHQALGEEKGKEGKGQRDWAADAQKVGEQTMNFRSADCLWLVLGGDDAEWAAASEAHAAVPASAPR